MMNYARSTTLQAVAGLRVDQLDYLHDPESNSIGALLSHIAATEIGYQAATFGVRDLNEEEKQQWGATLALGESARREIRGHELDHYLGTLEQVRAKTLAELGRRDDQWLDEHTVSGSGQRVNNCAQRATRRPACARSIFTSTFSGTIQDAHATERSPRRARDRGTAAHGAHCARGAGGS
jgi:hypothetical protein